MRKKSLKKSLGLLDVFAISSGAMISSGFFLLPGIAASKSGPAVIIAYVLAGFMILPALFSIAELSTAMPRSGGTYFFISRSLGPMFGTIDGIGVWLALVLKCSIALIGLGVYFSVISNIDPILLAVVFALIFTGVNLIGTKEVGWLQIGMVMILLVILAFFIGKGLPVVESHRFKPFAPFGWGSILPTVGFVFVSFIGLTKVASVSEEVKNPARNLPLGMLLSLVVVTAIYAIGVYVVVGVLPKEELYGSLTPITDTAAIFLGRAGVISISIAAILAFATTGNAGLLSASRYLLAMGRDRAIPHVFSRFSKRKTPKNAILLTSGIIIIIILAVDVESIAKLASTFQIIVFAIINVAVLVMRESGLKSYDPGFKSPFYPYMQIAGIIVAVVLIPEMGLMSTMFTLILIGLGIVWYNLYVRHRVSGVPAVAKVAERVAERLLAQDAHALGLDKELRQLLKEKGLRRDDPFAEMVNSAEFLEVRSKSKVEDLLHHASLLLSKKSGISSDLILGALLERSHLGETPAEAGVALPHLLLDEVEDFNLVFARSVTGIDFPMADQTIHAIFILLGNRKKPTQHLRFLAEIARRAEDPEFIDKWIQADNKDDLVQLLLMEE
ncbi:amino acid permease [bacterium]|nr:amino acid permease [bacterium]